MKTAQLLLLTSVISLLTVGILGARTWTEAGSGRTIDGDFVKVDGESVVIKRADGRTVNIPAAKLSEEDQAFLKSQAAPAADAAPEKAAASGNEVTLAGVHLCCGGCEKGVEKALAEIEGVESAINRSGKTVTLTSSSPRKLQDAIDALAMNGYYGESNSETLKIKAGDAGDKKSESVEVSGVHLCCGKCVSSIDDALGTIEGFESHNAEKGSASFTVQGKDITAAAVLAALRAEGLSGKVK